MKKSILVMAALCSMAVPAAHATVTEYTSQSSWAAALGAPYSTESFSDSTLNAGLSVVSSAGYVGGGLWNDRVTLGGAQTTFNFSSAINGVGGIWNLTPGGFGQGLELYNGNTLVDSLTLTAGTFEGFISTNAFTSMSILAGHNNGSAETYNLDDMVYGASGSETAPVPEPGTVMLLGAGFLGLAVYGKRRKNS